MKGNWEGKQCKIFKTDTSVARKISRVLFLFKEMMWNDYLKTLLTVDPLSVMATGASEPDDDNGLYFIERT